MDDNKQLMALWREKYAEASKILPRTSEIKLVASGFNTNVDAVTKINGEKLSALAEKFGVDLQTAQNYPTVIDTPKAVVCGIVKCFVNGIAEEWLTNNEEIDAWIAENITSDGLQMGGQGGIIGNVLALTGVEKILVNTASHPKEQADCFLPIDKLLAADDNSGLSPAYQINRKNEKTPVHRIIEFAKGERVILADGNTFVGPKANRFIASYDPFNTKLKINPVFAEHLLKNGCDYFIFAGYNLLSGEKGLEYAAKSADFLQNLKARHPSSILHFEIASTQDKKVRRYMLENIAKYADSLGLNERETLDCCEVLFPEIYEKLKSEKLTAGNLFNAVLKLKEFTSVKRIQLHIFGLFLCLQDKDYKYSPQQSLNGMICASVAAVSKAELGYLNEPQDLLYALNHSNAEIYLSELQNLTQLLNLPKLLTEGIAQYQDYNLITVPTMPVEKPKTLVGMGDTISSLSLVCAR